MSSSLTTWYRDQRSASPFAAGQAPSLKTNVNRAKTKRWVEAKSYTYDGDDWGDYDDDDQYGVEENQSLAPPKPVGLRQKGQTLGSSPASSSLSSDQAGLNRSNSYEHGDEQRAFLSGSQGSRALAGASKGDEGEHSIRSDASQSSLGYQKHRNFSPSVVPQPLYAKTTPSPSNEEVGKRYPARKSSLKADEIPIEQVSRSGQKSETSNLAEHDQPSIAGGAPFIRPADIYKRMEAEREKERLSLDSQRSGSDRSPHSAIGRHGSPGQTLRSRSGSPGQARDPIVTVGGDEPESKATLSPVLETDRGSGPTSTPAIGLIPSGNDSGLTTTGLNYGKTASNTSQPLNRSSFLPQVHRISGFGDDLWSSANNDTQSNDPKADLNSTEVHAPESKDFAAGEKSSLPESKSSVGYKAIVQQAFDRPDRSAMRTPLSAQESLDSYSVSRSNTDSTAGISPILSRMPSGAAVAKTRAKEAEMRAIVTPSINEESPQAQSSNYLTSLTSGQRIPRKPASRSTSGEYDTRQVIDNRSSELNSQSSHRVIANLPTVEQSYDSQHSAEADFEKATMGPNSPIYKDDGTFKQAMPSSKAPLTVDTEQNNRNSRIAARISDLSANSSKSPEATVLRAESPTKGRVRDLAGRFNDGSSKRDSSPSPSRSSMISLGKTKSDFSVLPAGQRNSIISDVSGRQPDSDRPTAQREASFRPYIPGRWESYNTTAGTPMPYDNEENKATSSDVDPVRSRRAADPSPLTQTEEEQHDSDSVDLTPKKTDGGSADDTDLSPDPLHMASLSQAGKAVGEALRASIGLERDDKKDRAGDDKERAVESTSTQIEAPIDEASQYVERKQSHSSASSSSAPSPPVKDRPAADRGNSDYFRAPEPLSVAGAGRSKQTQSRILRRTEESSLSDQDSDRLREEIEQTLSPAKSSEDMVEDKSRSQQMSSQTSPITSVVNRESSVFPSEYDSYWASTDAHATGRQSLASPLGTATESAPNKTEKDKVLVAPVSPAVHELPSYTPSDSKPKLSTRFSWETDISTPAKAGAANDKSEIESSTSPLIIGSQSSSQAQVAEPSPQPSAKDNFEEINLERRDSTGGELQPQMAAFGESSDPQIQTLSSSLGKEVTPEVPPKASSTTKPTPELPSTLDGKGDVSESALSYNEAFNASNSAVQQPSSRMRSESLPSNQPAIRQSTAWRPPPFREILAIKSPNERIETYDRYRAQLISTDSGLSQWIKSTIANQPEHSKMVNNPYGQPLSVSTSFPASLRQRGDSTSRLQSAAVAGTASAHPTMHHQASPQSSGGVAGSGARLSSQQVQAKGKDLLHSAGVIGGKASTISKGLFAKGRSRFKGGGSEKVDN